MGITGAAGVGAAGAIVDGAGGRTATDLGEVASTTPEPGVTIFGEVPVPRPALRPAFCILRAALCGVRHGDDRPGVTGSNMRSAHKGRRRT